MKKTTLLAVLALAGTLVSTQRAEAAGFAINEVGTRPLGMANAMTGLADNPSAVFFNPGSLGFLPGLQLEISLAMVRPTFQYDTQIPDGPQRGQDVTVKGKSRFFYIPSLYASWRIKDFLTFAIGAYSPAGLAVEWNDTYTDNQGNTQNWWGRGLIRHIELQTAFINPTIAVKLHERVSVGVGFVIAQGAVSLERSVVQSSNLSDDIHVELSGQDLAFGATAGVLVKVIPGMLNFGVGYRSAVAFDFEGDAAFTKDGSASNIPTGLRTRLTDGRVRAALTLPHTVSFGLAAFPLDNLTVSANVDLVTWGTYKDLTIEFLDNPSLTTSEPRNWNTSFAVRLGAEYRILGNNLPVRLGFVYDQSPAPDDTIGPELPDTNRYIISGGVGYTLFGIRADLAYQFLFSNKDPTSPNASVVGDRSAGAHILGIGFGYNFNI